MGYEIFEELCKQKGVTPYRVAKETGVTTATLSSWKNGKYTPKTDKLQKIADYFGVNVDIFTNREINIHTTKQYYENIKSELLAQQMFEDKQIHALYHVKRNIDPERFKAFYDMIIALYKTENPNDNYDFNSGEPSD